MSKKKILDFDLLILDIDGVLTNGTKVYDLNGDVVNKVFNDRDFTAIKRFFSKGINVCFLSGDKKFNEIMANRRNIDFFYGRDKKGNMNKINILNSILSKYDSKKFAYVGDDFYDLEIIKKADISFCPSDAIEDIKKFSNYILSSKGGEGVVAEIFDFYNSNNL
jgi:3-deoxy-D-manno-octulosonate 8-phosphate phosphatase (KDO 8-P phosphatase)